MSLTYTPLKLDAGQKIIKKSIDVNGKASNVDVILMSLVVLTLMIIASILYILLNR